jgi:hypothetical protein
MVDSSTAETPVGSTSRGDSALKPLLNKKSDEFIRTFDAMTEISRREFGGDSG